MGPWNPSPFSESLSPRNLYESIGMPCSVVILLFYAASSERFRKLRKQFFSLSGVRKKSATIMVSYGIFSSENSYPRKVTKIPLIPLYKIFPELQPDIRGKSHIAAFCTCFSIKSSTGQQSHAEPALSLHRFHQNQPVARPDRAV